MGIHTKARKEVLTYKPHLPRNYTEKHGQDHKLHAGTVVTRKGVNSRSTNVLCFSVFRVFPWLKWFF